MRSEKEIASRLFHDSAFHIEEFQGVDTLTDYQKVKILRAIEENPRTAIKACHGVGKTFLMAKVVLWFLSTHPMSRIITTAPTNRQVESLLWAEINSGFKNSRYQLPGRMLTTKWEIESKWDALGFSPEKGKSSGEEGQGVNSAFQGFHAPYILIIFDEATGIPKVIWDQAKGMLTSGFVRWVCIGNPTSRNCEFFKCFNSGIWKTITVSCFDSPNLKANKITDEKKLTKLVNELKSLETDERLKRISKMKIPRPELLTAQAVLMEAIDLGIDHILFRTKYLGEFPRADKSALFDIDMVDSAFERTCDIQPGDRDIFGVDPSGGGKDTAVIQHLKGKRHTKKIVYSGERPIEQAGRIIRLLNENANLERPLVIVDETGVGMGVVDPLNEAKRSGLIPARTEIRGVHFGGAPQGKDPEEAKKYRARYANLKAQMFDFLARDLPELDLLHDAECRKQLTAMKWKPTGRGQMLMESKAEFKTRTGLGSPDEADALALANFGRVQLNYKGTWIESENNAPAPIAGSLNSESGY